MAKLRTDTPRPDEIEVLERWPSRVEYERTQYEGEPNLDRLASFSVWAKCAIFALLPTAPFILLGTIGSWVGEVFKYVAAAVWIVVTLVSVYLTALDDNRGQV